MGAIIKERNRQVKYFFKIIQSSLPLTFPLPGFCPFGAFILNHDRLIKIQPSALYQGIPYLGSTLCSNDASLTDIISMLVNIYKIGILGFDVISIELFFLKVPVSLGHAWPERVEL